ncbi:tripartite tricarboxylate transporter substrate binding protein [Comamonas sp.]|uniref:Bug family tripartite tricarboxylate transporter substrate binding protein n=1 Tax=Comamonas sp. TaxID=34028 RepID=UPI0012BE94CF|nr:tripartite tricarboxylate transporter substrate binding protein [Comamonas sp.]MPS94589.1 tripartite tricarboxylate transporter substrate binding protein [Comamonas sp.]
MSTQSLNPSASNSERRAWLRMAGARLGAAGLGAVGLHAQAQSWPIRPIKWVVPYMAGTGPDNAARIVSEALSQQLGQPVVVENRPGAGGNIGARQVARARADGYTLLYSGSPMAAAMRMYKNPGFEVFRDFRHVMGVSRSDILLVVHPASGLRSLADLVAASKSRDIDYASGGVGTPSHLGVELLLSALQSKATHVPYKGASDLVNAVLGQQVVFAAPIFSVAYPHVQAGRLTPLAVAGEQRNDKLPQVPTLEETGVKNVHLSSWGGLSVPRDTPQAVTARLRHAMEAVLSQPKVRQMLEMDGGKVQILDSAAYTQAFEHELKFTETMMKRIGLQAV